MEDGGGGRAAGAGEVEATADETNGTDEADADMEPPLRVGFNKCSPLWRASNYMLTSHFGVSIREIAELRGRQYVAARGAGRLPWGEGHSTNHRSESLRSGALLLEVVGIYPL